MKKFYDVKLKISARHIEDNTEFLKIEESADCVVFDSSLLSIMTFNRVHGDVYTRTHKYEFPRGKTYTIEIEFNP